MKYEQIKELEAEKFRRLTGVRKDTFYKMVDILREVEIQKKARGGRKKRHTLKTQVVVNKKTKRVICTAFSNGKRHDFRLFKESKTKIHPNVNIITDTGYQYTKDA